MNALDRLYMDVTGDRPPRGHVAGELARLPARRRRPVELRTAGLTWSQVAERIHTTRQAAQRQAARVLWAINKRLLNLPRYCNLGHPPPARVRKSRHGHTQTTRAGDRPRRRGAAKSGDARDA